MIHGNLSLYTMQVVSYNIPLSYCERKRLPKVVWEQATLLLKRTIVYPPVEQTYTCLIPGPIRPTIQNRIHIRLVVLPQCTGQTDRQTYQQMVGGNVR